MALITSLQCGVPTELTTQPHFCSAGHPCIIPVNPFPTSTCNWKAPNLWNNFHHHCHCHHILLANFGKYTIPICLPTFSFVYLLMWAVAHSVYCMFYWQMFHVRSMAKCKTAVTPLLTHWSYCSLALSHRDIVIWNHVVYVQSTAIITWSNTTWFGTYTALQWQRQNICQKVYAIEDILDFFCFTNYPTTFLQGRAVQTARSLEEGLKYVRTLQTTEVAFDENNGHLVHLVGPLRTTKVGNAT